MTPWGTATSQTPHRSLWRAKLAARAALDGCELTDWLVDQANRRGFGGATNQVTRATLDPSLSGEEIVVGLLSPAAPGDGRVLKLATRIIQAGLDDSKLLHLARVERAERLIAWLVAGIPETERRGSVDTLREAYERRPPRGDTPVRFEYDFRRLLDKRATSSGLRWKPPQS